jgi:hypothetical protein
VRPGSLDAAQKGLEDGVTKKDRTGSKRQKRGGMLQKPEPHPGLERDSRGKAIPMKKRLPEDRAKAHRAANKKKK